MKRIYKTIAFILCLLTLQSCVKEIKLVSSYEPSIFIYGNLTNETDFVNILVLETTPVTDASQKYIDNAKITLYTENDNIPTLITNDFTLTVENTYKSSEKIATIIGNYYWIEVELQDGTTFKSNKERLLQPIALSRVSYEDDTLQAHFEDPENSTNFYHLEIASVDNLHNSFLNNFQLGNDVLFNGNKNAFIESETFINSATAVRLSNVNFETYRFLLNISRQNEDNKDEDESDDSGQLFASPPENLIGNIQNTVTNKKALGNFGVISKSVPLNLTN